MKIGMAWKIVVIAIVVIVAFTYGSYAMTYKGNYDVSVSFNITVPARGEVALTEFDYYSEPTSMLSIWDELGELRGKSGEPTTSLYSIFLAFNQSGEIETKTVGLMLTADSLSTDSSITEVSMWFLNKAPGQAEVRVYVVYELSAGIILDNTYDVVVG